MAINNSQNVAQRLDGTVVDGVVVFAAMRHLHDAQSGALVVDQILLRFEEHSGGQLRRTGTEVDDHLCVCGMNWQTKKNRILFGEEGVVGDRSTSAGRMRADCVAGDVRPAE